MQSSSRTQLFNYVVPLAVCTALGIITFVLLIGGAAAVHGYQKGGNNPATHPPGLSTALGMGMAAVVLYFPIPLGLGAACGGTVGFVVVLMRWLNTRSQASRDAKHR